MNRKSIKFSISQGRFFFADPYEYSKSFSVLACNSGCLLYFPATTNVKQPGGSLIAAVGVGKIYDISAIQAIVKHVAGSTNSKVFFPCGDYLVSDDIATSGLVELHGNQSGIAVIKASVL